MEKLGHRARMNPPGPGAPWLVCLLPTPCLHALGQGDFKTPSEDRMAVKVLAKALGRVTAVVINHIALSMC